MYAHVHTCTRLYEHAHVDTRAQLQVLLLSLTTWFYESGCQTVVELQN